MRGETATVRLAERSDGARLCELFRETVMRTDLHMAVERDPDFFALYDLEPVPRRTFVVEVGGRIEGLGTFLGRDAWLDGERVRVGYAGDLRLSPAVQGGFILGRHYGRAFREACEAFGCEAMLTAIIASNRPAESALVRTSPRFPERPVYTHLRDFHILSIPFTLPRRPRPSGYRVVRATEEEVPEVAEFLAQDQRRRAFGYVTDEAMLRGRLRLWPGLVPGSFLLARDPQGRLAGVTAPWDAWPVKRFRVLGYHGPMRWLRLAHNLAAQVGGFPFLPPPGRLFRYAYLTHVAVRGESPEVMAALLDRAYADLHGRGYHFLSAYVEEGDPLEAAFRRYRTTSLPARLYLVSAPGSRFQGYSLGGRRPGFEMALV